MSADWTPPAEAVEAAAKAMWQRPDDVDDAWSATSQANRDHRRKSALIALTAAYPAIAAEKDAEHEAEIHRISAIWQLTCKTDAERAAVRGLIRHAREAS